MQPEVDPLIAALHAAGAQHFDPVQLHYLALLSARAQSQPGRVKDILEARLAQAAADFSQRLEQARSAPAEATAQAATEPPGDTLAGLVRALAGHGAQQAQDAAHAGTATGPELKSARLFRNTWSKLSSDRQLSQALDQAPKNAGPINSHMLVLRSLAMMREISPDYLNRFMSYAQALLCLDQMERARYAKPKPDGQAVAARKPRASRAR
jgi:hypothetical protein